MAMSERSAVVGVFTDNVNAERAVNELRLVGFSDDEIRVLRHEAATGSFIDSLKSLFTGRESTAVTTDDFIRMGVPEQDAGYYQNELDAGRTLVLVSATGLQQQALGILRQYGAYDVTTRPSNV